MAKVIPKLVSHWNYFLAIEKDLESLSRYIEFDKLNFKCFSIEISRILLTASAEVDVVCKQICKDINSASKADNIISYKADIIKKYNDISNFPILLPRYGLELKPWRAWAIKNGKPPQWWTAYNKIKHHRNTEYMQGNLKNAIYSVCGLFIMVLYLYREKARLAELVPNPAIIRVPEPYFNGSTVGDYEMGFNYNI